MLLSRECVAELDLLTPPLAKCGGDAGVTEDFLRCANRSSLRRYRVLLVIGRVHCRPEQRDELIALLNEMQDNSRREAGCLAYGFFAAVENPLSFVAVEEWSDRQALDRHFAQPHLQEFARRLPRVVSSQPEVAIHEVADSQPFPQRAG
jgi:quinol monooxygenase YgiN